jgi:hypothetical protein
MFGMTIDGIGPYEMANVLAEEKILKPSAYMSKHGFGDGRCGKNDEFCWKGGVAAAHLARPEYAGHTVNFRSSKTSFKDKKCEFCSPDDWLIFENTHPSIVDQNTWDAVQRHRTVKRKGSSM